MSEDQDQATGQALHDLVELLVETSKTREGVGSSIRCAAEVSAAVRGGQIYDEDTGGYSGQVLMQNLEVLASGFHATVLALKNYDGVPDLDVRIRRLLVNLVEIRVGEAGDLNAIVDLQAEARALLTGE